MAAIGIAGLLSVGTALRYALVTRLGERVVTDIRKAVFGRVIHLSPEFFEKIMTGEVLSRITTDTTVILSVIGSSVSVALRNVFILFGGMILMLLTSLKLASLVFLIVPTIIVPILVLGRRLRTLSRENQDWIAASSGNASEALLAVQTVQSFSHENLTKKSFDMVAETSFSSAKKRITTRSFLTVIVIFLVFSGVVGVLWIGARDVRNELMSVGMLVQFVIYSVMVAGAVAALSEIWSELQRAAGATERLVELLNIEDTVRDPVHPVTPPTSWSGEITFSDVTFAYPTRTDDATLSNINLDIKSGETIALVGLSGAGKSTFIQLLQRFYDPDQGEILLDGIDIKTMNRLEFRKSIALVPQDPVIFASTVMEEWACPLELGLSRRDLIQKLIENKIMTLPKSETIDNYIEKSLDSMNSNKAGYNIETSNDGTHLLVNNVALAGVVNIAKGARLGGYTLVHQFCNIGPHSFCAMGSAVSKDIPAFVRVSGNLSLIHI
mgnify:CR=1 FL=1